MKIGLIGFPLSGKTTLFTALCGGHAHEGVASVPVPDPRLEAIVRLVHPKKVTSVHLEWHDNLPEPRPNSAEGAKSTLTAARTMDLLVIVLRMFDTPFAPYHTEVNPLRDLRFWLDECLLTDLQTVENRLERLHKLFQSHKETAADRAESLLLDKLKSELNEGHGVRQLELPHDARQHLSGFGLLTAKPLVVVANVAETMLERVGERESGGEGAMYELQAFCQSNNLSLMSLCATFEKDLLAIPPEEWGEYLELVGLMEPRLPQFVRRVLEEFNMLIFYTVVGEETRAWLLPRGSTAFDAAGAIHSDLARGFIRAEVCHFEDFIQAGGWQAAHHEGKTRLEGKEYLVQDGDVLQIRFKV